MEGGYGGHGPSSSWSYRREQIVESGSISSSPGTIVSTAYASSASRPSISLSMEAMLVDLEIQSDDNEFSRDETEEDMDPVQPPINKSRKKMEMEKKMRQMVQEFFEASSAGCSMSALSERWFTELGVAWVLQLADDGFASEGMLKLCLKAESWIWALDAIIEIARLTVSLFRDLGSVGLPSICEEEHKTDSGNEASVPDRFEFAQLIQNTISKMLAFIDAIVASNADTTTEAYLMVSGLVLQYQKIASLLDVHGALSRAELKIQWALHLLPSSHVQKVLDEIASLLSTKRGKAGEAIWNTLDWTRIALIEDDSKWSSSLTPQGSSIIHDATWSLIKYIKSIQMHSTSIYVITSESSCLGTYVPRNRQVHPFISLVLEMASRVEEKLANKSKWFPDRSLRFFFLLNNVNFIRQHLHDFLPSLHEHEARITDRVEAYIEIYIRVSWAPVLSRLLNPTPKYFPRRYSPLSKFESEFHKIYSTQKQWKVPDPELRKRLRRAITEKIIPGYTKYIEDNNVKAPKFTTQQLEEMLQELFEG